VFFFLQIPQGHSSFALAFSPDGKQLASGSSDNTVHIWDIATGQSLQELEGHSKAVSAVAFSSDGRRLASGSYDRTVRVWDTATWETVQTLERGHLDSVSAVAFSPDCWQLASGSNDDVMEGRVLISRLPPAHNRIHHQGRNFGHEELARNGLGDEDRELDIPSAKSSIPPLMTIDRDEEFDSEPPNNFVDPISHCLIHEAVVAPNGITYDRRTIEEWIQVAQTCPLTGKPLAVTDLIPNRTFQEVIDEWKQQHKMLKSFASQDSRHGG
jgi:WD40 repeat protein